MTLPMPSFYDPQSAAELYVERTAMVARAAIQYREHHNIRPSSSDETRVAAFGIDVQVGFCLPGSSLFVPGAVEDTRRTLGWLYSNLDKITTLYFSLDTHHIRQIFHPAWWVDGAGNHPAPLTVISVQDVREGRWIPVSHKERALEYCEKLEASGKYVLTVWPYHTLLGGLSHALVPSMMEATIFHTIARGKQTHFEVKGTHPHTENYSVLSPEVRELEGCDVGDFNDDLFSSLMSHDRVYVFGQAKSHCVLSTLHDLEERIRDTDPALASKVYVLTDAMSPVPAPPIEPLPQGLDFPAIADAAMKRFEEAGFNIVSCGDPL